MLALAAPTCAFIKLDPRISSTSLMTTSTVTEISETTLPDWTSDFGRSKEKLIVGEWDDDEDSYDSTEYRRKGGWKGTDFMHSKNSAVRVLRYYADYKKDSVGTSLEGIVEFTPNAESHSGYCHGGSMCAVFDDAIGWCGFLANGSCAPWSGFTAQINTALAQPVPCGSILCIKARITKRDDRKVYIEAELTDPGNENLVHATGEGLFILKRTMPE
eukprot:CAMPEP_0116069250 /NCGR_PEP_ID=MMETSP0322-20121206/12172_1 /TAXON_ID=163516 /ORGANISM="Leptocylindrus danicus var. apora, Strain B651" /LENGTH=215 /DNA_ID=CAMNT_0003556571 /DNA_START=92 /DNA_END=739 /DNA_ORIENTATION=+